MNNWTPPGNRSNQTIARWSMWYSIHTYKYGDSTQLTRQTDVILATATYKYYIGEEVTGKTGTIRYDGQWVTGQISERHCNIGRIEYTVVSDETPYTIEENTIVEKA